MRFPPELNAVLAQFHIESFVGRSEVQATAAALRVVDEEQRRSVRRFLEAALAKPYDAEELLGLIWASPADVAPIDASSAVTFLEVIRDSIDPEGGIVSPL